MTLCAARLSFCKVMNENLPAPFVNLTPLRLQSSPFEKHVLQLLIWAIQIFQIEQPKHSAGKLSAEGDTWFKIFVFINLVLLFLIDNHSTL